MASVLAFQTFVSHLYRITSHHHVSPSPLQLRRNPLSVIIQLLITISLSLNHQPSLLLLRAASTSSKHHPTHLPTHGPNPVSAAKSHQTTHDQHTCTESEDYDACPRYKLDNTDHTLRREQKPKLETRSQSSPCSTHLPPRPYTPHFVFPRRGLLVVDSIQVFLQYGQGVWQGRNRLLWHHLSLEQLWLFSLKAIELPC